MTAQKHTPGEWFWRDDVNTGEYDLSPGVLTTNLTDGTPWGDEIDRANARLIAAAPEMLEALKLARDALGANAARDTVDAAIAKATGQ